MAESEGEVVGLIDEVVAWLATEDPTPLAILGGYGAGKSSFAKRLVTQQAAQALTDPSARRPILIKLGGLSRYSDLEGFLGAMLTSQHNVRGYNFTRFLDFNSKGRFLIVLDGFDEMKHAMSFSEFRAQVGQFNQLITPGAKVVLLGRPSAFTTDAEHHYVLKGRIPAQDRWRKLPGWPEFREYRLADFSDAERDLFIAGFLAYQAGTSGDGGADAEWVDKRRQEVSELAAADPAVFGRPVHLKILAEMAADREQDLTRLRRSPSRWSLYDEFFQSLARREAEKPARTPIGEKDRLRFLAELAFWLWRDRAAATSFVAEVIPSDLLADLPDGDAHEVEHKRREYLAGAFLERKAGDIYYFPHRSFAEFLVASRMLSCPPQAGDHVLYGTLAQEGVLEFLQTPENQPRLRAWAETFVSAQGSLRPSYIRLLIDAFGGPNPLIQHIPSTYWTLPIRLIGGSLKIDPSNLAPLRTAMMQARVPELALALQLLEPHGVLASEDTVRQALEPMIAGVLIERTLGHVRELPQNDRLSVDGEEGERMRALATAGVKEIAAGRTGRVVSMNWLGLLEGAWAASQAHGVVLKTHAPQQASGYPPLELPLDVVLSTIPVASRPRIQGFLHKLSDLRHIIVVARRNLLPGAGGFDVAVCNPPFTDLEAHLTGAFSALADGGRLAAVVPITALIDEGLMRRLSARGRVVARIGFPPRAFSRHGTSVETGLLVLDRLEGGAAVAALANGEDLAACAALASAVPERVKARPRVRLELGAQTLLAPRDRSLALPSGRLGFLAGASPITYQTLAWTGEGRDVGLYQAHRLARIALTAQTPHPSALVESGPMASVAPPAPSYRPVLPAAVRLDGRISDAQLETVIYAGEAHAGMLPAWWTPGESARQLRLSREEDEGSVQLRRGFFLGDGTGCGKGREIAAVIADNMAQGRTKALWLSKNDSLLDDARRDWAAIGGGAHDIVPLNSWKLGDGVRLDRGIVFTTYATLRQPARGQKMSRLDQIVAWLGEDFDGVIAFDEAHAMANAAGGGKGARGTKKASLQGMAGLALQNRLPNARVLYVSATGATTAENLAYAARLGLWGGPEAPFVTRDDFLDAMDKGGVAAMELVARELKALGLYVARSLSFEGVEYEPLFHALTEDDISIWDAWADAFQLIHANLGEALKATGFNDEEGKAKSGLAASAVHSAFEGAKLRFFGHLLAGLKAPTLAASIRADLTEGRSAVIQIVSTNEAVMERRLASIPPEEWNNLSIDLTPREYVLDYLREAFPVNLMEAIEGDDGSVTLVPVMVDGRPAVSQEALRRREDLIEKMALLPAVPGVLDALLDTFGTEAVAEITGRSRRVVARDGRRLVERRGASAARSETDAFMSGRKRILVFSDAGGTGRSYHSDLSAPNQQRRSHYLVEPGWRADAAIQGLGRSHRTHQACPPLFRPVTTDIHGEKRFTSTIARRLDSLGALTRGERRTAGAGLFRAEDNLESPWARRALLVFYGALGFGELSSMTLEDFETRTGLKLRDADGGLKLSDDLPPIHTFLNRLLALRIADQNALFADFDGILSGILERAAASADLDRGLEDIEAEELAVVEEETIRTDVSTGAETALVTFELKVRRELVSSDAALAGAEGSAFRLVVNDRSGRAALAEFGLTTTTDDDRLVPAVRLLRPDQHQVTPEKTFEESAWAQTDEAAWRAVWDAEVAATDPWRTRRLTLATGLLLPIWGRLPSKGCSVRRVRAPDGRRWLGRVLDEVQAASLKTALGLTEVGDAWADGGRTAAAVLDRNVQLALSGGLWLKRSRVMDRWRLEVVGGRTDRDALVSLGCFVEIIAYAPRVFVPVDRPDVVEGVLRRHPVQSILEGAAA